MNNREKILQESKKLFNEQGFGAVSLFEIAQFTGISRGNITYHFKDKERILEALATELWERLEQERSKTRQFPSFENLHNTAQLIYQIQKEYAFIFMDTHVIHHELIKPQYQKIVNESIEDYKAAIAFSIQMGNLKPEVVQGTYNNIALLAWMVTFLWVPQQLLQHKGTEEDTEKIIWGLLIPHFTDKGLQAFKKFFGEDYCNTVGEPFNIQILPPF